MGKKCTICGEEAVYKIKDTSDYYCEECAKDYFSDLTLLVKVQEDVKKLKKIIEEKYSPENSETDLKADIGPKEGR